MTRMVAVLVTLAALLVPAQPAQAAACGEIPDMMILLDDSATMSQYNKWNDAKTAINNMLTAFAGTIRFGLVLFPTRASARRPSWSHPATARRPPS